MTPAQARALPRRELSQVMASGRAFEPIALAGWLFRGTTLGLPAVVERLTWVKFAKAFCRDPGAPRVRGWNVRVEQDGLDQPWRVRVRGGSPVTFGDFVVEPHAGGVVLDYRIDRTPVRVLRDPLVALDAEADLLLGRSLLQLGPARVGTPAYFLLERDRTLDHARTPPRALLRPR